MDPKLSARSIRFFLFADVLADLLQLEAHGGHGISTSPEMLAREISLFAAQSGYRYRALPFQNPVTDATWCLGGMAMHIRTWSGIKWPSKIWHSFCRAKAWKTSPKCRRVLPDSTLRRRLGTNTTWHLQSHREWDRL